MLQEQHRIFQIHHALHAAPITSRLHSYDFIVLIAYLLGTVLFGCYFFRKSRTPEQFTTAGGKLPGWLIGLSIFGTCRSRTSW